MESWVILGLATRTKYANCLLVNSMNVRSTTMFRSFKHIIISNTSRENIYIRRFLFTYRIVLHYHVQWDWRRLLFYYECRIYPAFRRWSFLRRSFLRWWFLLGSVHLWPGQLWAISNSSTYRKSLGTDDVLRQHQF